MRCGKQIAKSFSRRVCVPEPCQPRRQEKIRPRHKQGRRSADKRIVLPIAARAAAHPWLDAPAYRRFAAALATGFYPDGSAPEPGFPKSQAHRCFAGLPLAFG